MKVFLTIERYKLPFNIAGPKCIILPGGCFGVGFGVCTYSTLCQQGVRARP